MLSLTFDEVLQVNGGCGCCYYVGSSTYCADASTYSECHDALTPDGDTSLCETTFSCYNNCPVMSGGQIAGTVIGIVGGLALVGGAVGAGIYLYKRHQRLSASGKV